MRRTASAYSLQTERNTSSKEARPKGCLECKDGSKNFGLKKKETLHSEFIPRNKNTSTLNVNPHTLKIFQKTVLFKLCETLTAAKISSSYQFLTLSIRTTTRSPSNGMWALCKKSSMVAQTSFGSCKSRTRPRCLESLEKPDRYPHECDLFVNTNRSHSRGFSKKLGSQPSVGLHCF